MDTIKEAKAFLRANKDKGATCPCCGQMVKIYRRTINKGMAIALLSLYKAPKTPEGWVDIKALDVRGGDYAKLRYWALVEQRRNTDAKKKWSGMWRLTQLGMKFTMDRARVPKYARVYNQKFLGLAGDDVGIREVSNFDYAALMSRL